MKKIRVPEDMIKACIIDSGWHSSNREILRKTLQTALGWLVDEMGKSVGLSPMLNGNYQEGWTAAWRHIRNLFLVSESEEPEVPEAIKDLLQTLPSDGSLADPWKRLPADITNERIREAYYRGRKDREGAL